MFSPSPRKNLAAILFSVWLTACVFGMVLLGRYASTPSPGGDWQKAASSPGLAPGYRLCFFIHPKCACSAASLDELKIVWSEKRDGLAKLDFFVATPGEGSNEEWDWESLETRLQGWGVDTQVHRDPGGEIASRYGVETSGHLLAYDPLGNLVFAGGITGSRGHRGDNPGIRELLAALQGSSQLAPTPVFGCALRDQ